MKIDISNGYVEIKDFYPHGVRKKVKKAMFKNAMIEMNGGASKDADVGINGVKISDMDEAKAIAVFNMIEKVVINDKEMPINENTLDNLSSDDYDKIESAVDKITQTSEMGLVKS